MSNFYWNKLEKWRNAKIETSAIDKTVSSNRATIYKENFDISIKKIWVLQFANINQIVADARKPIISWDIRKIQNKQIVENDWDKYKWR